MKKSVICARLAAAIVCVMFVASSCSAPVKESDEGKEDTETTPSGLLIDSGDLNNNTGLNVTYTLNRDNGKYVCLYVENKGTNDVAATINGSSAKTLEPGGKGNIYVEVTQGFGGVDAEYVFKVVAGKNGGTVDINYEIVQGENHI